MLDFRSQLTGKNATSITKGSTQENSFIVPKKTNRFDSLLPVPERTRDLSKQSK
jgi:hypothetical protein